MTLDRKADVSALALEATLTAIKGTGWTNETLKLIKDTIDALNNLAVTDILSDSTPFAGADIGTIKAALQNATYGLAALDTDLGTLLTRLTSTRAGYLDELDFDLSTRLGAPAGASISVDIAAIKTEIDSATYGLSALDTDLGTLLTRLSVTRAGYLDNLSAGALPTDPASQARIISSMDFWSDETASVTLTAGGETGVVALPSVTIAIPTGVTILRVVALIKIALIRDSSGSDNAVDVATGHVEVRSDAPGTWTTAINVPDNAWSVDVSTSADRGGNVLVGSIDIKAEVDANDTYEFEFDDIGVDGNNLLLLDVITGLKVYFY